MRKSHIPPPRASWLGDAAPLGRVRSNRARAIRAPLSGDGRRALWPRLARMDGLVRAAGVENPPAGSLSRGGRRAPRSWGSDGGALGSSGGAERDGGPCFDRQVVPGGYAWWYVDALSEDGRHGLTVIAFIGSVFSPYYAWAGRRDPLDHCAVNVALYGPRGRLWSMTERRRTAVRRSRDALSIGPSSLSWRGDGLTIEIDEVCAPWPRRVRGTIRVMPTGECARAFTLDDAGGHVWRPIAPHARVEADLHAPDVRWSGVGYFDMNAGDEPLENGFSRWTWSRAALPDGAAILYDADRRRSDPLSLALRFDKSGRCEEFPPPMKAALPPTLWRLARETRSDGASAAVERDFEDTPFYSRSLVSAALCGRRVVCVHESLALDRFAHPIVRLMLPFRMPRR
jgi:carotenoid 1,2-hydratase